MFCGSDCGAREVNAESVCFPEAGALVAGRGRLDCGVNARDLSEVIGRMVEEIGLDTREFSTVVRVTLEGGGVCGPCDAGVGRSDEMGRKSDE